MKKICSMALVFLLVCSVLPEFGAELSGKTDWIIEGACLDGTAKNAIDGDRMTYWHSDYTAENRVIVSRDEAPFYITITLPAPKTVSGFIYTPRQDMELGRIRRYKIFLAGTKDDVPRFVMEGGFDTTNKADQTVAFPKAYTAQVFLLEIDESHSGYGCVGELGLIEGTGGVLPDGAEFSADAGEDDGLYPGKIPVVSQSLWSGAVNSARPESTLEKTLDGDRDSYWHSNYTASGSTITSHDTPPYELEYEIGEATPICGIIYTPRQDRDLGRAIRYELYAASDASAPYTLIAKGEGDKSADDLQITFGANVTVRRLKLVVTESVSEYGTLAEMNFMAADPALPTVTADAYDAVRMVKIEGAVFRDEAGTVIKDVSDGKLATVWQKGGSATLTVELPQEAEIAGIGYYPLRQFDFAGVWKSFDVAVSTDGVNFDAACYNEHFEPMLKEQYIRFDTPARARFLEITVVSGEGGSVSAAELGVYQTGSDHISAETAGKERYELTIGSHEILSCHGETASTVTSDVAPFIRHDITFIPLRVLLTEMGASVAWDGDKQEITIDREDRTGHIRIVMHIMDDRVFVSDNNVETYDTVRYTMTAPPRIENDRTFIPLRFVSEHLGYTVDWDGEAQKITVSRD